MAKKGTYCYNVGCVYVDDTLEVRPGRVYSGVEHESSHIYTKIGRSSLYDGSLHIHFDETGGCDLVVQATERINQEMFSILAYAYGNMVIDALCPAIHVN